MIFLFQLLPESVTNMERGRYYRNRSKSFSTSQLLRLRSPTNHMCTVHCAGSTRSLRSGSELTARIIEAIGLETSRWTCHQNIIIIMIIMIIIIIITKSAMTFFFFFFQIRTGNSNQPGLKLGVF